MCRHGALNKWKIGDNLFKDNKRGFAGLGEC